MLGLFLALALAYMVVVPPFEGFDVQAHYAAVNYYRSHRALPTLGGDVLKVSYELVQQPPLYYVLSAAAAARLPIDSARDHAERSRNAYFGTDVTYRQSIRLPATRVEDVAPATIARLVSLVGGLLVLLCTWWTARLIVPGRPGFAAAAAAVAALNPVLLFQSVTVTNDAWAAGLCALALACGFEAWLHDRRPAWWLAVGASLGLCGITKYSALLVVAPLSLLFLLHARRVGLRRAVAALAFAAAGFGAVGGWWYVRNMWLYGEIVPVRQMGAVILGLYRSVPLSIGETLAYVPWYVSSFWGVFVALIAPASYLQITRWFMIVGCAGALLAMARLGRTGRTSTAGALALLIAWLVVVILGVLQWARTVTVSVQAARLGFVGLSAFGIVMVAGWEVWLPRRWQRVAHAALVGLMACLALALVPFLHSAYALPRAVAGDVVPDRAARAEFGPGMQVLGADFPLGAAIDPGGEMPVRVYFTTDRPIEDDYTLFLHLAGADDRLLYHHDGAPAGGQHPTRQWVPGTVFVDTYEIATTAPVTTATLASLSLGFYPFEQPDRRVEVLDERGEPIGDHVPLGKVRVNALARAPVPTTTTVPVATWRNGIVLTAADVDRSAAGEPAGVRLTWSTTRTLHTDYTVFLQVLDDDDRILAQADRQPQDGAWPTSTWRSGDVVTDTVTWTGDVATWRRLIVGLYGADGLRLSLTAPGTTPTDAFDLVARPGP